MNLHTSLLLARMAGIAAATLAAAASTLAGAASAQPLAQSLAPALMGGPEIGRASCRERVF